MRSLLELRGCGVLFMSWVVISSGRSGSFYYILLRLFVICGVCMCMRWFWVFFEVVLILFCGF